MAPTVVAVICDAAAQGGGQPLALARSPSDNAGGDGGYMLQTYSALQNEGAKDTLRPGPGLVLDFI